MGNSSGFDKGQKELEEKYPGRIKSIKFDAKSRIALHYDMKDDETDKLLYTLDMDDNFTRETIKIYNPIGELIIVAFGDRNLGFEETTQIYSIGQSNYNGQQRVDDELAAKLAKHMDSPQIIEKGAYEWGMIDGKAIYKISAQLKIKKGSSYYVNGYNCFKTAWTRANRIQNESGELCGMSVNTPGTTRTLKLKYVKESDLLQLAILVGFIRVMERKQAKEQARRNAAANS